jgi:hypothetical protein
MGIHSVERCACRLLFSWTVLLYYSACCMALLLTSQITQRRGPTAMQMNMVDCTLFGRFVHANCWRTRLRGLWMTPVSAAVLLIYRQNISGTKEFCDIPGFCHSLKNYLHFTWICMVLTMVYNSGLQPGVRVRPRVGRHLRGHTKTSYVNQNETQEMLEPWSSSDRSTHEDSSPNWSASMPKINSIISLTRQNHINNW